MEAKRTEVLNLLEILLEKNFIRKSPRIAAAPFKKFLLAKICCSTNYF